MVLAMATHPASAQQSGGAKEIADHFANVIADGLRDTPIDGGFNLGAEGGSSYLNAGYYQFVVQKQSAAGDDANIVSRCDDIMKNIVGGSKLLSMVAARDDEVGVTLTLPARGAPGVEGAETEINLFRLYRVDGRNCRLEQSYFSGLRADKVFYSPLIPLDVMLSSDHAAEIKFRPWAVRTDDKRRISALWTGVGAFAKLLGPVGTIVTELFKKDDPYSVRSQAEASFFKKAGLSPSDELAEGTSPRLIERKLNIAPGKGSDLPRNRYIGSWGFGPNVPTTAGGAAKYALTYTVDIAYVGTRFQKGPAFKKYSESELSSLLETPINPGGAEWKTITPSFKNLVKQDSVAAFSAACAPAFDDLKALNFSLPDQALLIFAAAHRNGIRLDQLNGISCFDGEAVRQAMRRVGFPLPSPPIVIPESDRRLTLAVVQEAFGLPTAVGMGNPALLSSIVPASVGVGGDISRLTTDGSTLGGNSVARADFLKGIRKMWQFETGCPLVDWQSRFMPFITNGLPTDGQPVAFLARRSAAPDSVFLVIVGLSAKKSGGVPEVASLWVGEGGHQDDAHIRMIKKRMEALDGCKDNPAFAPFFAPPPVAPVPVADLAPAGGAPVAAGGTAPDAS